MHCQNAFLKGNITPGNDVPLDLQGIFYASERLSGIEFF